jgi:hypothetical protein
MRMASRHGPAGRSGRASPGRNRAAPLAALLLASCMISPATQASDPDADAQLLAHVPGPIAASCVAQDVSDSARRAVVSCHPGSPVAEVRYILFDATADMDAVFDGDLAGFPDATDGDCEASPGESDYSTDDSADAGRVFCDRANGTAFFEWTDTRFTILTIGVGTSGDLAPLFDWWATQAGPFRAGGSPATPPAVAASAAPSTPTGTSVSSPAPGGGPKAPVTPESRITGASIHQIVFATPFDPNASSLTGITDTFKAGTPTIVVLIAWDLIEVGASLDVKLFAEDRLVAEQAVTPSRPSPGHPRADQDGGFAIPFSMDGGFAAGQYSAELDYDGLPEQVASFVVNDTGDGAPLPGNLDSSPGGTSADLGPMPYADPAGVLVVTRSSALRLHMGDHADAVLAAAARVGTLHDLDADFGANGLPLPAGAAIAAVRAALQAGSYQDVLILGGNDTVPFGRIPLPDSVNFGDEFSDEQVPGDYVISDDPYTDLDADALGMPDLPVARIPTSDDADLMLTQLGDIPSPPTGAFAIVNEVRRTLADGPLDIINSVTPVTLYYSPPTLAAQLPQTNEAQARFVYVLLHGDATLTDTWWGELQQWIPLDATDPLTEYTHQEQNYSKGVTVPVAGAPGAFVDVGACFGAYTLDTVYGDTHKTDANSLALKFLASGSRAFVADTYVSISTNSDPGGTIEARTGFEVLLWQAVQTGMTPIDAFFAAKTELGQIAARQYADANGDGRPDSPLIGDENFLTVHEMAYYGRP